MPHSKISLRDAADFLHLPPEDLKYLSERGSIPFIKEKGKILFRKGELKDWASRHIFTNSDKPLGKHHYSPKQVWSRTNDSQLLLSDLLVPACIHPNLPAKTKPSVLKELVNLALRSNMLSDAEKLWNLLKEREDQNSTGLNRGIAVPHPRIHPPDLFFDSFLVIAKTPWGIPFGSLDGENCDLFFMPCAPSDDEHIFMLSRLASLLKKTGLANELRKVSSPQTMIEIFLLQERAFLNLV